MDGNTIDRISFETGMPRSTVDYYVRKFDKCAESGDLIVLTGMTKKEEKRVEKDEKEVPMKAGLKRLTYARLKTLMDKGEIDDVLLGGVTCFFLSLFFFSVFLPFLSVLWVGE